jgi:hypothetical protein
VDQLRVVDRLEHRGRMPAPDGAATHLRSHDSPTRAGADAPSDAVPQRRAGRPYGAAHAGADTRACAGADAAPDIPVDARTLSKAIALAQRAADAETYA